MNSRVTGIVVPIIAVVIYILIDFCYIFFAKSRYEAAVVNIQKGDKMEIDTGAAVVCYAVMAVGWYFIAVHLAISYFNRLKLRSPAWTPIASSGLSGMVAGCLYGFVLYGVFSLTTRALFADRYPIALVVQDIAWGTLFNTVYTSIFMIIWRKLTDPVDL